LYLYDGTKEKEILPFIPLYKSRAMNKYLLSVMGSSATIDAFDELPETYQRGFTVSNESVINIFSRNEYLIEKQSEDNFPHNVDQYFYDVWKKRESIRKSDGNVVLIDLISEKNYIINMEGSYFSATNRFPHQKISDTMSLEAKNGFQDEVLFTLGCERLRNQLRYSGNIIIIHEAYMSMKYYDKDMNLCAFPNQDFLKSQNKKLKRFYEIFKSIVIPDFIISLPDDKFISTENHKWGLTPYHYHESYNEHFQENLESLLHESALIRLHSKDPCNTEFFSLGGTKIFFSGGCELTYLRNSIRDHNIDVEIDHSFEDGSSMDPYSEINNPDSKLHNSDYDCLVFSQVQVIKSYLSKMHDSKLIDLDGFKADMKFQLVSSINAIREKSQIPIFIFTYPYKEIFPLGVFAYQEGLIGKNLIATYTQMAYEIAMDLGGIYVLDWEISQQRFPLNRIYFREEPEGGHPEPNAGRILAESFLQSLMLINNKIKPIKCIVLDCDNTLWKGVIREDGLAGIEVYRQRLSALYRISERGIVLALCTKNDPQDEGIVRKALSEAKGFINNIVHFKVNWEPKSKNISEIAKDLNISTNSIAFFDDNPFERDEVRRNLPDVRVYSDTHILKSFSWIEFQNKSRVTDTAKERINFYKTDVERKKKENKLTEGDAASFENYLLSTNLKLQIREAEEQELTRVEELLVRTNQQNLTLKRSPLTEIINKHKSPSFKIIILSLKDKFGDYGIIGASIVSIDNDIMNIVIDEFALSCRAMGKKVEHSFLIYLIRLFNSERYVSLDISVVENSRNQQMVRTLENAGFEKGEISERGEHTFSKYSFTQKDVYPEFPVWFELEIDD